MVDIMAGTPDHYAALSLTPEASADTIRKAARRLQLATHPDGAAKLPEAERNERAERFRRVTAAWETLGDPELRRAYDLRTQPAYDLSWLSALVRGNDVTAQMRLSALQSVRGGSFSFKGGELKVPPGVAHGARLRVVGAGGPGNPPGDLYLEVEVEPPGSQPLWRIGDDVHLRISVTWYEALRRGRFRLPTPWGAIETELPASVAQGGAELVVDNHGARPSSRPWGRLVVHVDLVPPVPDALVLLYLEAAQVGLRPRADVEQLLGGSDCNDRPPPVEGWTW